MSTEEPVITFGRWMKWDARRPSKGEMPEGGVYLFAHFAGEPPAEPPKADKLPYEVIYVGDAKDLGKRPRSGVHHKIERYREFFGDDDLEHLYVSVASMFQTGCDDYAVQRTASAYVEAKLIWNFASQHGHPPVMSVKKDGEGTDFVKNAIRKLKAGVAPAR